MDDRPHFLRDEKRLREFIKFDGTADIDTKHLYDEEPKSTIPTLLAVGISVSIIAFVVGYLIGG